MVDVRRAGDIIPPLAPGQGRLTLATSTESFFIPTGVVWVDADRTSAPLAAARPAMRHLAPDELPLAIDTSSLWTLVLWLLLLTVALSGAVWTWHRHGRAQAWIVFCAPVALVAYFLANQVALLLPNLM